VLSGTSIQQCISHPTDHPGRAYYFSILSLCLDNRVQLVERIGELYRAIEAVNAAVDITSADPSDLSSYLVLLGKRVHQFKGTGSLEDLDRFIQILGHRLQGSRPFLGYLLAYLTGVSRVEKLVDENIHLVTSSNSPASDTFPVQCGRYPIRTVWTWPRYVPYPRRCQMKR
jgi:hypothetical protein